MDERERQKCVDNKRNVTRVGSNDWMKPAAASLQRLDQVCTNIYNLGLTDSKQLKARSGHVVKTDQKKCNVEDGKPPLCNTSTKKTSHAWGSNGSIPDLIKKQVQREKTRPESAKMVRLLRPASAKKARPQSAKEFASGKIENSATSNEGVTGIKGSHCNPSERPDGASVCLAGTAWVGHVSAYDITQDEINEQQNNDDEGGYEYLYNGELLMNKEPANDFHARDLSPEGGAPPPPPRSSPNFMEMLESQEADNDSMDKMINGLLDNQSTTKKAQKPPHPLLRKPKPQPIRFAVPTADLEDDEIRVSFDENGVVINKLKYESATNHEDTAPSAKSQPTRNCQSPETLIGQEDKKEHHDYTSSTEKALFAHPKCVTVNVVVEDPGGSGNDDLQLNLAPSDENDWTKGQPTVKFDEAKNTMIEITPRQAKKPRPQSAKLASYAGRPELRRVKSRTDSGVTSVTARTAKKPDIAGLKEKNARNSAQNETNSEVSKPKVSMITVNYFDSSDEEEDGRHQRKSKPSSRITQEVDTCMSHFCSSDEADSDSQSKSVTKIISKPERNYYEITRNSPHPGSDSEGDGSIKKTKTVKTIELTSDGLVKETVCVSVLDVIETKPHKTYTAPRPVSAKKFRPMSAKKSDIKDLNTSPEKPHSQFPSRTEDGAVAEPAPAITIPVRRQRVRSAPVHRQPDLLAEKIREIHRSAAEKKEAQGCTCKGVAHRSRVDVSRQAQLKDNSVRRNAMTEKKEGSLPSDLPERTVQIWTRKNEFEIETEGLRECKEMHRKLIEAGVPVTLEALKRGLLPPTEYGFAGPTYKSVVYPVTKPNYTDSLLSDPATSWLSEEHKQIMRMKKKVREATRALEQQKLEEAREALRAEARAMKKTKRKGSKGKKKRPKSAK